MALKRGLDVVGSLAGLALLWPLLLVVAVAIKLDSPGPVFFRQQRVGRNDRPFRIFKFRSMTVDAPSRGSALTVHADKRITRVGAFLRRSKLDELPQLINVLVGDMALVGPRPEVPQFMDFYPPEQRALMVSIRPGMTDFAAILFRDESSLLDQASDPINVYRYQIMPLKFRYYRRYRNELNNLTDLRLILATILLLVSPRAPRWLGIESELPVSPKFLSARPEGGNPLLVIPHDAKRSRIPQSFSTDSVTRSAGGKLSAARPVAAEDEAVRERAK
jgi:lipopolysaccharide/colanic/teichoic acid biosynthesis glycosyltransferase